MANPWPPVHLLTCPYSLALPLNHVTGGFGLTCVAPEGKEEKELRGPGGNRWLPTRGAGAFLQLWGWIKVDSHPGPLPSPAACCSPHLRTPSCGSGQVVCRDLASQEQSLGSPLVLPRARPLLRVGCTASNWWDLPHTLSSAPTAPGCTSCTAGKSWHLAWPAGRRQLTGPDVCVPAGNICLGPPSKRLGTEGRRGQLELPGRPGAFGQELINFRPRRCGREGIDAHGDPSRSPGARSGGGGRQRGRRWWWRRWVRQRWGRRALPRRYLEKVISSRRDRPAQVIPAPSELVCLSKEVAAAAMGWEGDACLSPCPPPMGSALLPSHPFPSHPHPQSTHRHKLSP